MYDVVLTSRFKEERELYARRGSNMSLLKDVVDILPKGQPLPRKNKDHPLVGNWADHRECRIAPDWLLIYRVQKTDLILVRTGTHSDIYG
jgi:mRNA interferase YafQ